MSAGRDGSAVAAGAWGECCSTGAREAAELQAVHSCLLRTYSMRFLARLTNSSFIEKIFHFTL